MIEKKLEIILITYNRAKDLENTLNQLLESPFSICKITVLDNCSDDKTPDVCYKYQKLFKNMVIVRHPKNIGANPNILRAVETSQSLYTWILCDDDNYSFDDCDDVINTIENEEYDLIIVSEHYLSGQERGLKSTSKELVAKGVKYFHNLSFIPSSIFKTCLFDSYCLHQGYFNVHNLYPHFPFIVKSFEKDFKIYISRNKMVEVGTENITTLSNLHWVLSWMNSCNLIKDKNVRKDAIYFFSNSAKLSIGTIFLSISLEKLKNNKISKDVCLLINSFIFNYGFSKEQLLIPFIILTAITPKFLIENIFKLQIKFDEKFNSKDESIIKTIINDNLNKEANILRK